MPKFPSTEPLGRRIAALRAGMGLTQQSLAARLAMSRNAVSLLETGLSQPSERTVVLLAGLFGVEPHELVAGTDYPAARSDRLPSVAARHTEVEARLVALDLELRWVTKLSPADAATALAVIHAELAELAVHSRDQLERQALRDACSTVSAARAELASRAASA